MTAMPDLVFKKLDAAEAELAVGVAGACSGNQDPRRETWGISPDGLPPDGGEPFGLFVRGTLAAAAWFTVVGTETLEIAAMAVPRGRWGMGLAQYIAAEAARVATECGVREVMVRLAGGGPAVGELLQDAEFTGPDPEAPDYPTGEWRRPIG